MYHGNIMSLNPYNRNVIVFFEVLLLYYSTYQNTMVLMIPQFPIPILDLLDMISGILHLLICPHLETWQRQLMARRTRQTIRDYTAFLSYG